MSILYALAALGAYRVVRRAVIIGLWLWKIRNEKPSPGLFTPRGTVRSIHG